MVNNKWLYRAVVNMLGDEEIAMVSGSVAHIYRSSTMCHGLHEEFACKRALRCGLRRAHFADNGSLKHRRL